jgi:hypothetical protein
MSWLTDTWNNVTGKTANNAISQQNIAANKLQKKIFSEQRDTAAAQQAEMERREAERQANILGGNSAIDSAFAQFGPEYFKGAQDSYSGYYLPQIDEQRGTALDKLTAQLAGRGLLESTVGANKIAKVNQTADEARAKVGNEAVDFGASLRGKVDASKNSLYDISKTAADPSAVGARATGEATSLAQTGAIAPSAPLGDLFGSILAPLAYGAQAYINSPQRRTSNTNFAPTSGGGSSRVMN